MGRSWSVRGSVPRAWLVILVLAPVVGASAPVGIAVEGTLGIPLGPDQGFWSYRTPTSLLARQQFVIAVSAQAADVLNRQYRTGRQDQGYALGVSGGAIARWEYGVTGVWALGSGQAQQWTHPTGLYSLSPSPRVGLMAVSHAWGKGAWAFGGTIYRTSFSLSDTFVFERFPTSSDRNLNTYLVKLLPEAIGKTVDYDALGNRLAFFGDAARRTPVGTFGLVLSAWTASADWLTQHTNTITDTNLNRNYLAGSKTGDGHAGWHGTAAEARWHSPSTRQLAAELRVGRGSSSGNAAMWLRTPARALSADGEHVVDLEPRDWANDAVTSKSWTLGLGTHWTPSAGVTVSADLAWGTHRLMTEGFARTPVLTLVQGTKGVEPVHQGASFGLEGWLDVLGTEATVSHHPATGRWEWEATLGMVRFDGAADTDVRPVTVGFTRKPSNHSWTWHALRLAYGEVSATRQMTQQISLTYAVRQYLPISGSWGRDGSATGAPGAVSGIRLGSMHQVRAAMRL